MTKPQPQTHVVDALLNPEDAVLGKGGYADLRAKYDAALLTVGINMNSPAAKRWNIK